MKKILLGTTALVAAAGFSGLASAQQVTTKATSLSIAGSVEFEAAYADNDTGAARKIDFLSDGDFTFSPKYVADNGLTTIGRLDFAWDKNNSNLATDELSITFQSASFGSITLGDDDGAADTFWQGGPTAGDGNWDGSATRFVTSDWSGDNLNVNLNGDATKIYYSTSGLDLAGFTFGASYTPKNNSTFDTGTLSKTAIGTTTDAAMSDLYDVGGSWSGDFSGVTVSVAGSYISGKRDLSSEDPSAFNVGGKLGFGALTVGGGYTSGSNRYAPGKDDHAWAVGATYAIGAYTVGATYQKSDFDDGTTTGTAGTAKVDSTAYGAAVTYAVAPGVTALGEINQFKDDDNSNDTTVVMLGTKIAF
ncbi:porin [Radicibacter daui]|uniref:porin n=1 Tax=Radicibacter daui TaxID=3064829 RepID=UPI0040468B30